MNAANILLGLSFTACTLTVCGTTLAQSAAPTATLALNTELLQRRGAHLDRATGLVWARCLVGQQWDGRNCIGSALAFSGHSVVDLSRSGSISYAGLQGWAVPTIAELITLRKCATSSSGAPGKSPSSTVFIPGGTGGADAEVKESCSTPGIALDTLIFPTPSPTGNGVDPEDQLVTYSFRDQSRTAYYLEVNGGRVFAYDSQLNGYVRLVLRQAK